MIEGAPYTPADIEFLRRVARNDGDLYVRGAVECKRAKRLAQLGVISHGLLGPRYVRLTQAGRHLVQRVERQRGNGAEL